MENTEKIMELLHQGYITDKMREKTRLHKMEISLKKNNMEYKKAVEANDKASIAAYQDILNASVNEIHTLKEKQAFLREPTTNDYLYRMQQKQTFASKVAKYAEHKEAWCFHGTDIVGAKHIIESGQISSGADRLGHATSFDPRGKISVTNKDTVGTSVEQYMNLTGNFSYPAGCLFAIRAKDRTEYDKLSSTGWMIDNVNFKDNPGRLVAIITTPENIETVTKWAKENHIDVKKVMDFEKFIEKCKGYGPKFPPVRDQMRMGYDDEPKPKAEKKQQPHKNPLLIQKVRQH